MDARTTKRRERLRNIFKTQILSWRYSAARGISRLEFATVLLTVSEFKLGLSFRRVSRKRPLHSPDHSPPIDDDNADTQIVDEIPRRPKRQLSHIESNTHIEDDEVEEDIKDDVVVYNIREKASEEEIWDLLEKAETEHLPKKVKIEQQIVKIK